jgi:hypothetical protein
MLTCARVTPAAPPAAVVVAVLASGGPSHTGRLPARADPADGPPDARSGDRPRRDTASDTVAVPAVGHDVTGRCHRVIGDTFTLVPCTTCTGTALPACAAGAERPPLTTWTKVRHPATSAATDSSVMNTRRGRRKDFFVRENIIYLRQVTAPTTLPGVFPAGDTRGRSAS